MQKVPRVRADIGLWNNDINIYVEVKTKSQAYHKQLFWYHMDAVRSKKNYAIVYLTIDGMEPPENACYISDTMEPAQFKEISNDPDLVNALEHLLTDNENRLKMPMCNVFCASFIRDIPGMISPSKDTDPYLLAWENFSKKRP
ncbi:MAG: PD-(D/E)XK nuclease family protein [Planctomycetes bacterium]|nr:PD-(D/E)XK nuclease family protein [Planctomycetota bacterium]